MEKVAVNHKNRPLHEIKINKVQFPNPSQCNTG